MKRILNKIPQPPGAIPARAQTWLLVGLTAAIAVTLVSFPGQADGPAGEGDGPDSDTPGTAAGVGVAAVESAADQIREKAARQAEQRMRERLGLGAPPPDGLPTPPERVPLAPAAGPEASAGLSADEQIEREERIRSYRALRAPSLVQSVRARHVEPATPPGEPLPAPVAPGPPALAEPVPSERALPAEGPGPADGEPRRQFVLREGEFLEAVLANRLAGSFVGPVSAMVSADAYDRARQRILVPRGTRALGEASRVQEWGQSRLAVSFHRLILPDGTPVGLDQSVGLNQIGETGLRDRVDRHYLSTLAAAGAVGVLAGLSQAVSPGEALASRLGSARVSAGSGLSRAAERILDRYLNRLPKVTIREGHRIRIYLTRDLSLPAYRSAGSLDPGDMP